MILKPGFHRNVDKATYLSDPTERPSLSASIAHLLVSRSPAHAWSAHPKGGNKREDPTAAMVNGTIIDSLLVGGDAELVESPHDEYRTNEAKAWKAAALAAGKVPVKRDALRASTAAASAIQFELARQGVVLNGENQVTAVWEENSMHGPVICKARFDHVWLDRGELLDLKTADSAHPEAFARKMLAFGYGLQYAAYVSAVETLMPELAGRVKMRFAVAETDAPYACLVAHPAGSMRTIGQTLWRRAVEAWGAGIYTGHWPGYASGEMEIEAPPWAMAAAIPNGSDGIPF